MSTEVKNILALVQAGEISPAEGKRRLREARPAVLVNEEPGVAGRKVAVIGVACRYGGGDSPAALWRSLESGACSIREVPPERWSVARYYDPDVRVPGKTNSRWGGFLDDVDAFDPLLFNLSGREAELMDPQQRLFLESCWTALEDAGYAGSSVSGMSCGVFAGAPASDYATEAERTGSEADAQVMMGNDAAILAARISYLLNLRGPSIALNTACSSSLVAVHLACQAIEAGQCELALAGGVCLFLGPSFYLSAAKGGMLSPRGLCRPFDKGADGFVPGEGVGVVVLKDLEAAVRDGDNIRGVILATGTNQDGKTNGITAPSARSQTALEVSVYQRAGISPETISLLEAHGTGTPLGDPVEVEALTRAFNEFTDRKRFCAIGSIKGNIGHTGQAAGIAGLIKCLLAFEHDTIPPTLHFEEENERIDFAGTPFFPVTAATAWPRRAGQPRRAAVSSFGYSGTNAHLVLEEPPPAPAPEPDVSPRLVLVSAKTPEALGQRLSDLRDWLGANGDTVSLADVAFTLHAGRQHFAERAAFVARDIPRLRQAILDRDVTERPARLSAAERQDLLTRLERDLVRDDERALRKAAVAYEKGVSLPVRLLFPEGGRRVAPPTYPFARERYWHAVDTGRGVELERTPDGLLFHPDGREFFLADHVIAGRPVLAAMTSVELARLAGATTGPGGVTGVERVTWHRPLTLGPGDDVRVTLRVDGDRFEIGPTGEERPTCTGTLLRSAEEGAAVDLAELHRRCTDVIDHEECYRRFGEVGLDYGPGFRAVRELRFNDREVLARLELPAEVAETLEDFPFHPSLLDGALQSMIALADGRAEGLRLPHALDRLVRHEPLVSPCFAWLSRREDDGLDIRVVDETGRALVSVERLVTAETDHADIVYLEPVWQEAEVGTGVETAPTLICDLRHRPTAYSAVPGAGFRDLGEGRYELRPDSAEDWQRLLEAVGPRRVVLRWGWRETAEPEPDLRLSFGSALALAQALSTSEPIGPVTVQIAYPMTDGLVPPHLAALGAFARTVRLEDPDVRMQTLGLPPGTADLPADVWADGAELRVLPGGRVEARELRARPRPRSRPPRDGGVFLITGGAGHIGRKLARHLVAKGVHVVLVGRSPLSPDVQHELGRLGVTYERADVSDEAALNRVLAATRARFGRLDGVVHAAGVTHDSLIVNKDPERVAEVLKAKIDGVVLLDRLTRDDPLDFMVFFSSLVGSVGNVGQADYAYANAFLDEFAEVREALRRRGERTGKTISIAWPAWAGGGMAAGVDDSATPRLSVAEGLAAFDDALGFDGPRLILTKRKPSGKAPARLAVSGGVPATAVEKVLIERLAEELRVPAARIDPDADLAEYGIDSIVVTRLTQRLEEEFGPLPKTIFFRYRNLAQLAGHLAERQQVARALPVAPARPVREEREDAVAIIGVSGRYPQAADLNAFWDNLVHGRDCVTEIPPDRWSTEGFYDPAGGPGKSYTKWGGFLSDIDKFDPLFFNVSPKEADMIDPQERLFLQTVWHTLEDAGYPRAALRGGRTGVFVGAMYGEYQLLGRLEDGRMGVSSHASIANRVSYFFDFHGPSIALDTMCSSSLTAIHLACESLRRGECDTAVVGGVNLNLHPRKYLQLSLSGFASTDGKCRSFGADGDGYVPGEGIGALLLKPLGAAVSDGDTIHAVIRGTAVNHGGKTNGYTVPSPLAQGTVIGDALRGAGVRPDEIGYVEAHGTGTALGDPIEVAALTEAFGEVPAKIPIGSVKSVIGHLESAAGIAAVTKVLLQMRHRTMVPSLHADRANPNIDFAATPFRVQRELAEWTTRDGRRRLAGVSSFGAGGANAHVVMEEYVDERHTDDDRGPVVLPLSAKSPDRLAALAAQLADFLDAGIVIDDLLATIRELLGLNDGDLRPDDSLRECGLDAVAAARLSESLALTYDVRLDELPDTVAAIADRLTSAGNRAASPLPDVAYTLQVGREAMPERVAVVATDSREAARKLRAVASGKAIENTGELAGIARSWERGEDVDWSSLHEGRTCRRVSLPGYPFATERHWLDDTETEPPVKTISDDAELEQQLVSLAADVIGLDPVRLDPKVGLGEYGFESVAIKTLADRISDRFGVALSPTVFYERTGIAGVAQWLREQRGTGVVRQAETVIAAGSETEPIAVIGMSGRFPGSPDLDSFWENLRAGRDLVTEVPEDRWSWRALASEDLPPDQRCPFRWGGFIDDVDKFDPLFFGISPAEAEMMDPQQRLLLETVWAAVEDAGYRPSQLADRRVGLFAGLQFNDYQHLLHEAGILNAQSGVGNEHAIAVNRISYLLDFHGPSEPVNTACSSSLVALHRAVRSLRNGESTLAIAGGIALNLSPHSTVAAGMMGLLSPDGRCKTLDSRANGYVKGEGVGVVVLKPLRQAIDDGDQIHAVIRGTAVNHGGRASSLTAPNSEAQAALLRAAAEDAGVGLETVGYLELHGTGTELGDPVEINGIKAAFGEASGKGARCGIGSVKTNVGHLEPASGVAGLIKVILAMRHQTLPSILHLDVVNRYVDLDGSPFHIVREASPWTRLTDAEDRPLPLRAGVSSFGFGGVNAHVIVEEPPRRAAYKGGESEADRVFVFSARTGEALTAVVRRFIDRLDRWEQAPDIDAVAFTLRVGREELAERLAVVAPSLAVLRQRLTDRDGPHVYRGQAGKTPEGPPVTGKPDALARAWVGGSAVDWTGPTSGRPQRVSLPSYPFERKRYWFSAPDRVELATSQQQTVSGETYVHAALRGILLEKLKLDEGELEDDRPIQDYGVDSMIGAMVLQTIQEEFDVQLPLTALAEHSTLSALSAYIHEEFFAGQQLTGVVKTSATPTSTSSKGDRLPPELLPINTDGTKQTSFWVHGATGYSTWMQNLSEALGSDYPLYAFQARGTDGVSMPQSLDEMVDHYVHCIRLVQSEGPYVIGGYSLGGIPAMEIARRLHEEGEEIRHLIMFDTYPATQEVFDRHFGGYDEGFLQFYMANYFLRIDEHPELAIRKQDLAHLPSRLHLSELAKLAKERGNKRVSEQDIYRYLRGGLECSAQSEGIYQIYKMRQYDASDILFFRATDGFTGKASELYWPPTRLLDGYDYIRPWQAITGKAFRVVDLDNDHLNMLEEPTLTLAARHIEAVLKEPPPLDWERYNAFRSGFEAMTAYGGRLLAGELRGTGALPTNGTSVHRDEIRARLGVRPEYDRLFHASLDLLEREGYLREEEGRLTSTSKLKGVEAGEPAISHPDVAAYVPLLNACQTAVAEVMQGRREGTEVIFPGGSMELVADLYKTNIQTDFYNRLVADQVEQHVRQFVRRFPRSTVRVFEVGAGSGGTTAPVLETLKRYARRMQYLYTDIGTVFTDAGSLQFGGDHPFMDFAVFDVERAPERQGFEPHSMDVVIAANVLHATRRIAVTLEQCRRLLKPGGVLVINELTQRLDYNTLTFGLTTGWWIYEDEDKRIKGSPLLQTDTWRRCLGEAGFDEVAFYGLPGVAEADHAQSVIVAKLGGGNTP